MNEYDDDKLTGGGTPEEPEEPTAAPAGEPTSAPAADIFAAATPAPEESAGSWRQEVPEDGAYRYQYRPASEPPRYTQPSQAYRPAAVPPPAPAQPKKKKPMSAGAIIAICIVCSLLAAAVSCAVTYLSVRDGDWAMGRVIDEIVPTAPPELNLSASVPGVVNEAASTVYQLACQQVVGVTTEMTYTNFFGQVSAASVSGSGFIISADGYILTNNHVIEDARQGGYDISVLLHDGSEYTAELVGYDKENDIAVLKIDAAGLTPAELGDTDSLTVGQVVYAVGNPLGELNYTMTTGIVSAMDRAITTEDSTGAINMFQIDAAVNSGNSGGPVYNAAGQVVGVVTAKTSATGVEGLGFAIPIDDAAHIANQILEHGYVTDRADMGITSQTVPASVAERYGMAPGAYVEAVTAGGPAGQAGIREGDIITAIDGKEVAGRTELSAILRTYAVGDAVTVSVWRNGQTVDLAVTLGESEPPVDDTPQEQSGQQFGYDYGDLDDFFRQFFGGFGF